MQEIQNKNFNVEDEECLKDIPLPYKLISKKPTFKIVTFGFSNTKMKFLPDHVALGLVDNILNPKIHEN